MRSKKLLLAALPLMAAGTADAATYVGTRTIGTGSVNLSITTDNTVGALTAANITAYTINLFNADGSFTLTQANSGRLISGTALRATATDLLFDFGASGFALFQAPNTGSGQTFYCLQVTGCYTPSDLPGEAVEATTDYVYPFVARSGLQTIASVANAGVPEPATWGMMILGFGIAGAAARRRAAVRTTVRYA